MADTPFPVALYYSRVADNDGEAAVGCFPQVGRECHCVGDSACCPTASSRLRISTSVPSYATIAGIPKEKFDAHNYDASADPTYLGHEPKTATIAVFMDCYGHVRKGKENRRKGPEKNSDGSLQHIRHALDHNVDSLV
ncbi:hypothetical protein PG984_011974 [Apiospora sp. TS-2023a]